MENAGYMFSGPHKRVHELFTRRVAEIQGRFEAGEDVGVELHGMLSRWLFNHIRNEDHSYIDAVKAYMRMTAPPSAGDDGGRNAAVKAEVMRELAAQQKKKGWLARLLGI
jgi:hemerythrin